MTEYGYKSWDECMHHVERRGEENEEFIRTHKSVSGISPAIRSRAKQ